MTTETFELIARTAKPADRPLRSALQRGFLGRCPHCGEGKLFRAYLKVVDHCAVCGEDMSPQRADDAPAYLTMLIVGHFVVTGILVEDDLFPAAPMALVALGFAALATASSLLLLPRLKGALIGYQWAMRMHGFGGPEKEWI